MIRFSDNPAAGIDRLCEALTKIGESASVAAEAISKAFSAIAAFAVTESLKNYATDRQWHLLCHGSPRVRKKWQNALIRRMRLQQKRQPHPRSHGKEKIADGNNLDE